MADTVTNEKDLLFVSWTNRDGLGKELGEAFSEFFSYFDLGIEVFYSDKDLGSDWYHVLNDNLQRAKFGVFCITPKAVNSEWVNYELGSILNNRVQTCKSVKKRVFPIQLSNTDRINRDKTPFAHNNVKQFCADELEKLIEFLLKEYISKNKIEADIALDKHTHVNKIFKLAFGELKQKVEAVLAKEKPEEMKNEGSADLSKLKTENNDLKSKIIKLQNQIKVIQTPIQTPSSVIESAPCEIIDLGFSDFLWADRNIGANSPTDYGDYFAWGETKPKDNYSWDCYKYCQDGDEHKLTKYCTNKDYGKVDDKKILDPEDDAATKNWGNGWRMPTMEEYRDLFANSDREWTKKDGVNGCEFTSKKNGNKIFFPAAGVKWDTISSGTGSSVDYWSSTLGTSVYPHCAEHLYISSDGFNIHAGYGRCGGNLVRAVRDKN